MRRRGEGKEAYREKKQTLKVENREKNKTKEGGRKRWKEKHGRRHGRKDREEGKGNSK